MCVWKVFCFYLTLEDHLPRMLQVLPETRKVEHKGMTLKWWNVRSDILSDLIALGFE